MVIGMALMAVAAVAIALSVVAWLVLGRTSTDGAQVTTMPGSVAMEMTAGDWAVYSRLEGGSHPVASTEDITIDGPGEVTTSTTYGFFSDTTTIELAGHEYEIFMRLDVPQDGTYDITFEHDGEEEIVIGKYPDHDVLATVVVATVVGAVVLGTAGFVVLVVGLVLWLTGRRRTPMPGTP